MACSEHDLVEMLMEPSLSDAGDKLLQALGAMLQPNRLAWVAVGSRGGCLAALVSRSSVKTAFLTISGMEVRACSHGHGLLWRGYSPPFTTNLRQWYMLFVA